MSHILHSQGRVVNQRHLEKLKDTLLAGEIAVLPTETGYCFAGLATHKKTHAQLLALREAHPKHKPFSLLCKDAKQITTIAQLPTAAYRVVHRILPGPFTIILPVHRNTPQNSMGEFRNSVGIRMTNQDATASLLNLMDVPLMVTSVTDGEELMREGYTDEDYETSLERWWTTAEGIFAHTKGRISVLLTGDEPLPLRVSTIIDLSVEGEMRVLRDGGWPLDHL